MEHYLQPVSAQWLLNTPHTFGNALSNAFIVDPSILPNRGIELILHSHFFGIRILAYGPVFPCDSWASCNL